jgi:DNA-directed RNA polymerase specialized sigma24 family protein
MEVVKTVREFALKNEEDLRRYYIHHTHITDPDLVREAIQEFYVKLIQGRSLETYDPSKGTFKTYIMNMFHWLFPILARRNLRMKYTFVSQVLDRDAQMRYDEYTDVFEILAGREAGPYLENVIDPSYEASHAGAHEEDDSDGTVKDFSRYVQRSQTPNSAKHILPYLEYQTKGCSGADIAQMLGVSNNMVKFVKEKVADTYEQWKGHKMSPGKKARKLTRAEIADEIRIVQDQITRYNSGEITLPAGFSYREAVLRLKYLRNRQAQIKRRKPGSDQGHSQAE